MRKLALIALLTAIPLAACARAISDGDAALVVGYAPDFQAAAAAEYEGMAVSCQPNDATTPPGCAAIKTMVNDYLMLRDQLRVGHSSGSW